MSIFNIRAFRVGGLRFLKLGRITFMICVSKPKARTRIVLDRAAPFRLSADGVLVLGYGDETN
jgi:hypothetical protein